MFFFFFNFFQKRLHEQREVTEAEVLSLLKLFSEIRDGDFVVNFSGEEKRKAKDLK